MAAEVLNSMWLMIVPLFLSAMCLVTQSITLADPGYSAMGEQERRTYRLVETAVGSLLIAAIVFLELLFIGAMFLAGRWVGLAALLGAIVAFVPPLLLAGTVATEESKAREGWAKESELTSEEIRIGSRELVRRRQWRLWASTAVLLAMIPGLPAALEHFGPEVFSSPGYWVIYPAALFGLVFISAARRAINGRFPEAHFLALLDTAIRAGARRPRMSDPHRRSLPEHRERRWGFGGATLLQSISPLRRSLLLQLNLHPALCQETALAEAETLRDEFKAIAASRAGVSPCAATRRALHLVLRGEFGPELTSVPTFRPFSDPEWDRDLRMTSAVRWVVPVKAAAAVGGVSTLVGLATSVADLVEKF